MIFTEFNVLLGNASLVELSREPTQHEQLAEKCTLFSISDLADRRRVLFAVIVTLHYVASTFNVHTKAPSDDSVLCAISRISRRYVK